MSKNMAEEPRPARSATREPPAMQVRGGAFEVAKTGASRFDFSDPYYLALAMSWPAFALTAFGMLLVINLLFALLYLAQPGCIANLPPGSLSYAFFFSLETLATVGYGEMAPVTSYGHIVAAVEIFLGMAVVAVLTGLLFVRFSRPKAKILFAEQAVIGRHEGKRTLMIRVANGRMTSMSSASAELGALIARESEGQIYRGIQDLKLVRHRLPLFSLTWTLMHVIDEDSPISDYDAQRFAEEDVRLFLTVKAIDDSLGSEVRSIQGYDHRAVLFDARYADAVSRDEEGRTIADLSRLSLTEPA